MDIVCSPLLNVVEGAQFTGLVANFITPDANPQPSQFSSQILWGDGSLSHGVIIANPDGSFGLVDTHTFTEEGSGENVGSVSVTIQDLSRNRATVATQSTPFVADATLTSSGVNIAPLLGTQQQYTVANFTDADANGAASDYSATIDWGDGTPTTSGTVSVLNGAFTVTAAHQYQTCGTLTATIQITDAGGSTTTATSPVTGC